MFFIFPFQKFVNTSHGIFTPTNITFKWESNTIAELALTFNEQNYSTKLQFSGESLDDNKFFAFILQIIDNLQLIIFSKVSLIYKIRAAVIRDRPRGRL